MWVGVVSGCSTKYCSKYKGAPEGGRKDNNVPPWRRQWRQETTEGWQPTAVPHSVYVLPFSRNKSLASLRQGERITVDKYALLSPGMMPGKACLFVTFCFSVLKSPNPFCRNQEETTEENPAWRTTGQPNCLLDSCFTEAVNLEEGRGLFSSSSSSPHDMGTPTSCPGLSRHTSEVMGAWWWIPAPKTEGTRSEEGRNSLTILGVSFLITQHLRLSPSSSSMSCFPVMCPSEQKLVFTTYNIFLCSSCLFLSWKSGCWQLVWSAWLRNQGLAIAQQRSTLRCLTWLLCRMDANALSKKEGT